VLPALPAKIAAREINYVLLKLVMAKANMLARMETKIAAKKAKEKKVKEKEKPVVPKLEKIAAKKTTNLKANKH